MSTANLADEFFAPQGVRWPRSEARAKLRPGAAEGIVLGSRTPVRWIVLAALFGVIAAASCGQARGAPLLESSCANGFDDDADLMADCADPDCSPNPVCVHGG